MDSLTLFITAFYWKSIRSIAADLMAALQYKMVIVKRPQIYSSLSETTILSDCLERNFLIFYIFLYHEDKQYITFRFDPCSLYKVILRTGHQCLVSEVQPTLNCANW